MSTLPDAATLPSLAPPAQDAVLAHLFEPSAHLHALARPLLVSSHCSSYPALIAAVRARLEALADEPAQAPVLLDILAAHPRLGASPAAAAQLSEASRREQANLAADGQADVLRRLNAEYEERFPGLRYVVFVDGRGRDVIMQDMRRRIERGDIRLEIQETIQAMCDIANDRAARAAIVL